MYYSPILFSRIAHLNLTQYHDCKIDMEYLNSKERIIVFCTHSIDVVISGKLYYGYLNKLIPFLNNVSKPFILISAMEDTQFPSEIDATLINKIVKNKYFKHWFSINKTIPNDDKFTSIPYGLNYWTLTKTPCFGENIQTIIQQNSVLESITNNASHFSQRIPKIYSNFHFNCTDERHGGWRKKLLNIIPKNIIIYEKQILPRIESYKCISKFSFVVSPFGHGFDCIRTFEALCLGCIVIMKKSFLDIIYEDLPILLVDEWSDINETLLQNTLEEFKDKQFNYNKLKMDYWVELVGTKW
jgi:hypothetical protein